ncbi:MAG: amino acid ABC transporter substrate-binding protein [SAR324 cluster bacterium]|uniref:Amino acid ABC transporter substrate-binding protein n=1 Tax=SAR324 cluster bacterium TaxID=2024889 RepID=A0A7X9FPX9_9DELT|nr:amino acid ABC transporter substrate-binding protein [SAR324 cluster bacterium]
MLKNLVLTLVIILGSAPLSAYSDSKLKVGAILALSGDFSAFGKSCQNSIELAKEELAPEMQERMEIIIEDDGLNSRRAVDAFHKLASMNQIAAVITFTSGPSNAIAPLAESMRLPMLAIGASDPNVVKGKKFVNSLWVSTAIEAKAVYDEAKRRGYKRIARIGGTQEGVLALKKDFDALNKGDFDIVLDEDAPADMKDFRSYAAKLRNQSDLDAIFAILMPGQSGIFTKQVRQQKVTQPFFNVETFEDPNDVKLSEGAMVGAWYVQADAPTDEFLKKFQERFPDSSLWGVGACYDAIYLIAESIKKKIPLDRYLRSVKDFKGAQGTFSSMGNGYYSLPVVIKVVTETGFEKQ